MFFNKVLVAVDDSEQSARAVAMVIRMAKASLLSSIVLVNIYDSGSVDFTKMRSADKLDALKAASMTLLKKYEDQLNEQGQHCQITKRTGGDPASVIIDMAEEDKEFDLIIMGSRKLNKLKELTLGSVSDKVTRLVSIPVLVIK